MLSWNSIAIHTGLGKYRDVSVISACLLVVALFLSACGGAATTAPSPAPTSPAAGGGATAGQLADRGKTVYAQSCASCHGDRGQGVTAPAVIGSSARLGARFNTGKDLYDYVRTNMPQNNPGSLSAGQYLDVVSYLLVENGHAQRSAPLSADTLSGVQIKR